MKVMGVPFNSAGRPDGVARAPQALRDAGLIARLRRLHPSASPPGPMVRDCGEVEVGVLYPERDTHSGLRALASLEALTTSVRDAVAECTRGGDTALVVGGDCPVLLGSLRGASDVIGDIGLLFVDGHEDAWPPALSTTGEAADCELGLALGMHREDLPMPLAQLLPTLDPGAVVVLGPRDADDLAANGIPSIADRVLVHTDDDLRAGGDNVAEFASDATDRILHRVEHWWLHVDLDVLSADALPAVDYPQPAGLTWSQLESLTSTALRAPGCVGITLCIFNPALDPDTLHAGRIVEYLGRMCSLLPPTVGDLLL